MQYARKKAMKKELNLKNSLKLAMWLSTVLFIGKLEFVRNEVFVEFYEVL